MDSRVGLLRRFSGTFDPHAVKVETEEHGLPFLEELLSGGATLEYGELTPLRLVHRYRLAHVTGRRMEELLQGHVDHRWNVCRYFDPRQNDVFCFNVDNHRKSPSAAVTPEVDLAVRALRAHLVELGCTPLVVASGRGYHVWCRLAEPVPNERLYHFELVVAARALAAVVAAGYDHAQIKINLYPHIQLKNTVSLRLIGSRHAKTRTFSHVLTEEGLLDEAASWACLQDFVVDGSIPLSRFEAAWVALTRLLQPHEAFVSDST